MALDTSKVIVLAQNEAQEGVDPGSWAAATQAVAVTSISVGTNPTVTESAEKRGTRDAAVRSLGAIITPVNVQVVLKGSGTPETPPEWSKFLKWCGWEEDVNAATIPAASVADCTGGSTTTCTIDRSLAPEDEFPATTAAGQVLVGQPIEFTVNPATPFTNIIESYSVAGNVVTIGLVKTMAAAIDATSKAQVKKNVLWTPKSATIPSGAIRRHLNGMLTTCLGLRGTMDFQWPTGAHPLMNFQFQGSDAIDTDTADPTDAAYMPTNPQSWMNGYFTINRIERAIRQFTLSLGQRIANPPNPNQAKALDPAHPGGRDVTGTMNPLRVVVATAADRAAFVAGTPHMIFAELQETLTAGQRISLFIPQGMRLNFEEEETDEMAANTINFQAQGADNVAKLCQF